MRGMLRTNYECPDCSSVVDSSGEQLRCTKATNWGDCGSTSSCSEDRDVTKKADKICTSCQRKKEDEERKKKKEREEAALKAIQAASWGSGGT
ncbi:hypothetical protein N0V85_001406 [Neurospora sp. IMI 360204]|nr:hypothetical protein N0V85_001406 [Neurospora sp. IMI 360204]